MLKNLKIKKSRRYIILILCIIAIVLSVLYFTEQRRIKNQNYLFELSQIDSALGLLIKYSQNYIESPNTNDFAFIVNELSNISTAVDSLYLQNIGIDVNVRHELYKFVDNLNGTFLTLDDDTLITYSSNILAASKDFYILFDEDSSVDKSTLTTAISNFVNALPSIAA